MFCSQCGKELNEGAKFCSACGAQVVDSTVKPMQGNVPNASNVVNGSNAQQQRQNYQRPVVNVSLFSGTSGATGIMGPEAVKRLIIKLIFAAVAITTFVLSWTDLFGGGSFGDFFDSIIWMADIADEGFLKFAATVGKWSIIIGVSVYLLAVLFAFLGKESSAHGWTVFGFLCHILMIIIFVVILYTAYGMSGEDNFGEAFLDLLSYVDVMVWVYLGFNVVLMIISGGYIYGMETAKNYDGKTYSLLGNESAINTSNVQGTGNPFRQSDASNTAQPLNGSWRCEECGKMNANYVGTCACGASKR
ncbi:MAG: zinc ribbon domain-containing protein [Lachnospiraceae bacterium]|nr:zinc ribbon domain-containing protein [Lachnospiraceae bacterium]